MALVIALVLAGCSGPPMSSDEFAERMMALDGVTSAEVSTEHPVFGATVFHAKVGVTSDVSESELQAIFGQMVALPALDAYTVYEDDQRGDGVRWEFTDHQTLSEHEFVAAIWPDAASLPDGTRVYLSGGPDPSAQLSWHDEALLDRESITEVMMQFVTRVAAADPRARLTTYSTTFDFKGVPTKCDGLVEAVEALLDSADVTSLEVECSDTNSSIEAFVGAEESTALVSIQNFLSAAGLELTVTADDPRAKDNVPPEVKADAVAVRDAAREVPGAPAAWSTPTGIVFEGTDEQTVRALLETVKPMPEFERVSFSIGIGATATEKAFSIAKSSGQPFYTEALFAIGKHPEVHRLWAEIRTDGTARHHLTVQAPSVEEAVSILRSTGIQDARGAVLHIDVAHTAGPLVRIAVVVGEDGELLPLHETDDQAQLRFLDAWNGV